MIVERKLRANPEIRREVVGQILALGPATRSCNRWRPTIQRAHSGSIVDDWQRQLDVVPPHPRQIRPHSYGYGVGAVVPVAKSLQAVGCSLAWCRT